MISALIRIRKSIFAKFSVSFIAIGLIPLLVLSYFSLNAFNRYLETYAVNNYEQMLLFAGRNVDDMYVKYNSISKLMYSYGVAGKYGQLGEAIAAQSKDETAQLSTTVDDFIRTLLYTDKYLQNVFYVYPDGKVQMLSKENKPFDMQFIFPDPGWHEPLEQNRNMLAFIPTHFDNYFLGSKAQVMTFGRNLTDVLGASGLDGRIVGTVFFDVNLGAFDEIFQQMRLNPKDVVNVVHPNGSILYSNKPENIGSMYKQTHTAEYLHMQESASSVGWTIAGDFYKADMLQKIDQIIQTIMIVIGLCIAALVAVAIWFSNRFSRPIRRITKEMTKVESGNFNTQVEVLSDDELGLLSRGFNKMVVRLQSFIDEVYVAQIKQKQAELGALKSQIRPHYLYNTLEVIRMSAVASDDHEVAEMILALSKQLKYILDSSVETVSLLDEKDNVEQYFRLMQLRYGEHRLSLDFRFEADVLGSAIPKLSLQPIVENAITHGILPKQGKGTIRVAVAKLNEQQLYVTVDDDGVGMDEEQLERVRRKLKSANGGDTGSSIGLKNVHDRIAALYGQEYGIEVNSSRHVGTSINMVIPFAYEVKKT